MGGAGVAMACSDFKSDHVPVSTLSRHLAPSPTWWCRVMPPSSTPCGVLSPQMRRYRMSSRSSSGKTRCDPNHREQRRHQPARTASADTGYAAMSLRRRTSSAQMGWSPKSENRTSYSLRGPSFYIPVSPARTRRGGHSAKFSAQRVPGCAGRRPRTKFIRTRAGLLTEGDTLPRTKPQLWLVAG